MNARRESLPNSERQVELDAARGLAVFFMIAVHVLEILGDNSVLDSWYGYVVGFLGGPPAAPVFMALLGVGLVYGRNTTVPVLARRGLLILSLGYLLNVLRGALPALAAVAFGVGDSSFDRVLFELVSVDIFHFAGLTLLFFAGWKSLGIRDTWLVAVLAVALAGNAALKGGVGGAASEPTVAAAVTGLFWGSSRISYFPFLSWIVYPVMGYFFGRLLIRTLDKKHLYRILTVAGLVVLVGGAVVGSTAFGVDLGFSDEYAYYHHGITGAVAFSGFAAFWFGVVFWLRFLSRGRIADTLGRWSRNVSAIYFVHWVILGWTVLIVGPNSLGAAAVTVGIAALAVFSDVSASVWVRRRKRVRE